MIPLTGLEIAGLYVLGVIAYMILFLLFSLLLGRFPKIRQAVQRKYNPEDLRRRKNRNVIVGLQILFFPFAIVYWIGWVITTLLLAFYVWYLSIHNKIWQADIFEE